MKTSDHIFIEQLLSSRANIAQVILAMCRTIKQLCKWLDTLVEYYESLAKNKRKRLIEAAECVREELRIRDH